MYSLFFLTIYQRASVKLDVVAYVKNVDKQTCDLSIQCFMWLQTLDDCDGWDLFSLNIIKF